MGSLPARPTTPKQFREIWKPARAELAGQPMTDAFLKSISLKLDWTEQRQTFHAIYELKGNTLRICSNLSGAKRPTEFNASRIRGSTCFFQIFDYQRSSD